ncbi:palmitoyl-protein thioesterase 1-like protein [Cricetulus griseus]|uniref:Palmitoyl-protein thioesterase 1-like protein n=1 Tax=Cricetulus griseus TaxID=10029 RepID=A0A061ID24_CRIGR|nr:palmitoyl-protein thioesterase 1-like protein [Cricetulus griseus]
MDPVSESQPVPVVTWYEKGFYISKISTNEIIGKEIPGIYVLPLVIGNNITEEMESNIMNSSSQVCEILAKYFAKLQQGYIVVTVSKRLKNMIPRALPENYLWICICFPRKRMKTI